MKSKAFFIFHLNLAFSSIEKESRKKVINNCYHPLLDLVEKNSCQIGIEMTGWTLEEINRLDPHWVTRFKKLINSKSCELIGSGYSQLIGPLVPYNVNFWNQKLGLETYLEILETKPDIVLVNEMAFSSSMVDIYNEFNFKGMIMDRDNVRLALGTKKLPTKAQGLNDNSIQILWSDSILFQKIQHYAHGDISKKDYLTYIESRIKSGEKILPLYCNDAEVFDYRPGRFSEERPTHSDGEWNRIFDLLESIKSDTSIEIISPTQVLEINKNKAQQLSSKIVSTQYPIPVKKQSKYNIARWSVTGRDDIWINTMCHRISKYLDDSKCSNKNDWKTLCQLWSSDYRTHITEKRWKKIKIKINETLKKYSLDHCNTNQKNLSTNNNDSIESVLNKIKSINLNIHNDNTLKYYVAGSAQISTDYSDYDNKFTHIVVQRNSGTTTLYLDGVSKGTWSDSTDYTDQGPVVLGRHGDSSNATYCLDGYMSNVRVVKGSAAYTPTTAASGIDFATADITTLASNDSFDFGTNDFTIEFFYKWSTNSGYQTILNHQYNATDAVTIQSDTGTRKWGFFGSSLPYVYESTNAPQDVWLHYAFVRNGNTIKIYRDGVETYSQSHSGSVGGTDTTEFGHGNTHYDKGKVSNFRVIKGTALYTSAGFTVPTSNLTAVSGTSLLLFQENSGSTLSDGSSNNVTVTKGSNHSILTSDGPFYGQITVPTSDLGAITNTKLLALKESAPKYENGGCFYVNSRYQGLQVDDAALEVGTGDFTIEFYYRFESHGDVAYPLMFDYMENGYRFGYSAGSGTNPTSLGIVSSGSAFGGGGGTVHGTAGVGLNIDQWYHFAMVRTGGNVKVYIDGVELQVPKDSANRHYAAILEWVAEGNTIAEAN